MRLLLVFMLFLFLPDVHGQLLDSIGSFLRMPGRPSFTLDAGGSFINNRSARIVAFKAGLEHGGRVGYGVGYHILLSPVLGEAIVSDSDGSRTVITRLRFGYVAPYFAYTFFVKKRWEVSIPVQLGFGSGSLIYTGLDGKKRKLQKTGVVVYEPAMKVQYRFWRYAAVQLGLGYRLVFRTTAGLGTNLTAPIYVLGIRVFFRDVLNDIRGKG